MESAALVAPLTHHPFVSKSQAPSGWNLLQQVAPLTHLAPVTHHRTVVGTCHWWVTGRRPNSLEYQICTAPEPFDTLVTGLVSPNQASLFRQLARGWPQRGTSWTHYFLLTLSRVVHMHFIRSTCMQWSRIALPKVGFLLPPMIVW